MDFYNHRTICLVIASSIDVNNSDFKVSLVSSHIYTDGVKDYFFSNDFFRQSNISCRAATFSVVTI